MERWSRLCLIPVLVPFGLATPRYASCPSSWPASSIDKGPPHNPEWSVADDAAAHNDPRRPAVSAGRFFWMHLVGREAVEQTGPAGALQRRLAAAAARRVRRVPRPGGRVVAQADPVVVPDHGSPLGPALGPVAAGPVV